MKECGVCGGAGKVISRSGGERVSVACEDCDVWVGRLVSRALIPPVHAGSSLDTFNSKNKQLSAALSACKSFPKESRWLLLSGPTGVGKTHLMVGIIRKACASGFKSAYLSCEDLFFEGRLHASGSTSNFVVLSDLARSVPLLCLDELGCGRGTEFEVGIIQEIINSRYNNNLHTVYATNYRVGTGTDGSLEGCGKIGAHSLSRLMGESRIVEIDSDDWRLSDA